MRILVLICFGLFLSACQGNNPYGLTTASIGDQIVSSATGQAGTGLHLLKGLNTFHCTQTDFCEMKEVVLRLLNYHMLLI